MSDKDISEANRLKSEGVKKRWGRVNSEDENFLKQETDRKSGKWNYKCFDGLKLSSMQKQFIVTYMDPPYLGKKEFRYEAYKKVFNASTENSCRANCSALLAKSKIKEGMRAYQVEALKNHKLEVTSESIEALRRRANYSIDTFFTSEGECKPLSEIPDEWLICIDNIKIDKKSNAGKGVIEAKEYKLCDRDKAMEKLQKLLGVFTEMEEMRISVPTGGKNAIDSAGEEGSKGGPRIVLNMSIGNPNDSK